MVLPEKTVEQKYTPACKETSSILLSLGYTEEEINQSLPIALNKCEDKNSPEEILRETLKILSM